MKKTPLIACLVLLLAACETTPSPPDLTPELLEPTLTIREMQTMGDSTNALTFNEEHLIGGVVTASDASGNFYRSFVIEDFTGAVEVMAGSYDLHTLYPVGRVVYVRLKGLTLGLNSLGIWQLGYPGTSARYAVGYIGGPSKLADRHVARAGMNDEFGPAERTLSELTDNLIGRLVTVRNLTLSGLNLNSEATWATPGGGGDTDVPAVDAAGRKVFIRTSDYADFAGDLVPTTNTNANITGILMKEKKEYLLKIRDSKDIFIVDN